jgi:hypothetical protein
MTISNLIAALPIGQTSTSSVYAPLVGTIHCEDNTTYMLVKSSGAITAAQNAMLIWDTGNVSSYLVDAVSGAAATLGTLAGVAQLPSADVATLTYFWVARRGPATITVAGAIAESAVLATHGTAGALDDTTVTYDTACARAMNAIASGTGTAYLLLG